MPAIEVTQANIAEEPIPEESLNSKPVIGIIYPPPEVRNIVDKTASFVARNGPEFETRIRQNELNNPKFNFLNPSDPYHAYYQHKVKEFKEGKGQEPMAPKLTQLGYSKPSEQQAKIVQEPVVPKEPPPEFEFVADPPSISAFDLDVVKLTAQFVARNGRQFLTNLMNREQKNYQFDFLRPQHSLFNYFTKLVEQYTKILIPPKDLLGKLRKECENYSVVLDQVKYRVDWAKYQESLKRKEEEAVERERVAYAQIDWHDFVVVETVDFQPNEQGNFPPPTTPEEVGARILAQERFDKHGKDDLDEMEVESGDSEEEEEEVEEEPKKEAPPAAPSTRPSDNITVQDMEEGSSSSSEEEEEEEEKEVQQLVKPPAPPPPPPPPKEIPQPPLPPPDQVIIKKDYNPKARTVPAEGNPDQYLISPITGEKIPADKVQQHMKIGLLDPKWIEERNRAIMEKREQEEVYAPGSAIESSLKQLAERRTDIFGIGTEETQIGKKIGEEDERKKEKVVWDGHTASMEKVTQKARENISIEEQIAVIHKAKGLLPDEEKEKIGPTMPKTTPAPPPKPPVITTPISVPPPPPPKPQPPKQPPPPISQMIPPTPLPPVEPPRPPMNMQPGIMVMPPRPPMPIMGLPPQPPQMMPMHPPGPPGFPSMMQPPPGPPGPPQPRHPPPPSMLEDEPPSKKQKTEDQLIPEDVFLRNHKGPVKFRVLIPKMDDKPEWKLHGQTLTFTLPLTDTVSVIKAKLNEAIGMPAGKQKLQYDGLFIKDSNSLAFYNFVNGTAVSLQLKERGGRKK
ncbi:hypothetical protein CHS0354_023328 [Potamilus streckersoni]|uniref:Splicing factor 3A subunit 1 n=1 Tax=Potamilus streckersoni TaxID=2493646 RepID=A0AAE0T5N0_9BIVA|nr:hypothetical protein CHS0354_023328 [Potamilus streckersoni]